MAWCGSPTAASSSTTARRGTVQQFLGGVVAQQLWIGDTSSSRSGFGSRRRRAGNRCHRRDDPAAVDVDAGRGHDHGRGDGPVPAADQRPRRTRRRQLVPGGRLTGARLGSTPWDGSRSNAGSSCRSIRGSPSRQLHEVQLDVPSPTPVADVEATARAAVVERLASGGHSRHDRRRRRREPGPQQARRAARAARSAGCATWAPSRSSCRRWGATVGPPPRVS